MNAVLKLRPSIPEDEPFLRTLRAQFDSERLGMQHWGEGVDDLIKKVLELQFRGYEAHYKEVKSNWETRANIVEINDEPVGHFIITGDSHEIHLCDIVIDRRYRGLGLGAHIIETIKTECMQSNRPLRLHVDKGNPAYQFYVQQGFQVIEDKETHLFMEWSPKSVGSTLYSFSKN